MTGFVIAVDVGLALCGFAEGREPVSAEKLEQFETDVLAGFVWPGPRPGYGRHDPR
ncbi:hypothetical protein [Streptomyces sp. NPDC102437]|uniref:hypothetical protein n=1 Tax=Streptomyces sp. NPDC102437 TaxID=3366175 RepID=UPI0037F47769